MSGSLSSSRRKLVRPWGSHASPSTQPDLWAAATSPDTAGCVLAALAVERSSRALLFAVLENPNCPAATLAEFAADAREAVRDRVAAHPSTPPAALLVLAMDDDVLVREFARTNPSCPAGEVAALDWSAD